MTSRSEIRQKSEVKRGSILSQLPRTRQPSGALAREKLPGAPTSPSPYRRPRHPNTHRRPEAPAPLRRRPSPGTPPLRPAPQPLTTARPEVPEAPGHFSVLARQQQQHPHPTACKIQNLHFRPQPGRGPRPRPSGRNPRRRAPRGLRSRLCPSSFGFFRPAACLGAQRGRAQGRRLCPVAPQRTLLFPKFHSFKEWRE